MDIVGIHHVIGVTKSGCKYIILEKRLILRKMAHLWKVWGSKILSFGYYASKKGSFLVFMSNERTRVKIQPFKVFGVWLGLPVN